MKKIIILLALVLGTMVAKAQVETYYITGASVLSSDMTEWSDFRPTDGTITVNENVLTLEVPSLNLNITANLTVVAVQEADDKDKDKIVIFSCAEDPTCMFGLIYCPHYETFILRVMNMEAGLQFTYSKYKEVKNLSTI